MHYLFFFLDVLSCFLEIVLNKGNEGLYFLSAGKTVNVASVPFASGLHSHSGKLTERL